MNGMDGRDLMRLMIELTAFVKPSSDAMLVVTLKLPAKVSETHADKLVKESIEILEKSVWRVTGRFWLLANRSNERTLVAVRE